MTIKLHKIKPYYELKASSNLSNLEKGRLRKLTILDWIFRFRYSSLPVLVSLFPKDNPARIKELLTRMENRNEIRKFALVTGFTKVGYCLTESGFLYLQQSQPTRLFTRFFTETATLSSSNFVHDLAIQTMIAKFLDEDPNQIGFANEWEVRRYFEGKKGKLPDSISEKTVNGDLWRVAIEVELSYKSSPRLAKALESGLEIVKQKEADAILYICPTPALANTIERKIKEMKLPSEFFQIAIPETLTKMILGGRK